MLFPVCNLLVVVCWLPVNVRFSFVVGCLLFDVSVCVVFFKGRWLLSVNCLLCVVCCCVLCVVCCLFVVCCPWFVVFVCCMLIYVRCCLLFAVSCLLFVVCCVCLLLAVCCLLFGDRCCLLCAVGLLLFVVWRVPFDVYCIMYVVSGLLLVAS